MQTITATELARHTRQVLDTVAKTGEIVAIERNQVRIATLLPAEPTMTARQALQGIQPLLSAAQGKRWSDASRGGFDEGIRDPWG